MELAFFVYPYSLTLRCREAASKGAVTNKKISDNIKQ